MKTGVWSSLAAVVFTLAVSVSARAQQEPASTVEVLPRSSDAFVLTPAAPSVSHTVVVDSVPRADITVTALSHDLEVTLISPRKARYKIGHARPGFESFVSGVPGLGSNYRAILKEPAPGKWTVIVSGRNLTSDVDVVVNVLLQSEIFVALAAGDIEHRPGAIAGLALAGFEGSMPLRGLNIEATLLSPTGVSLPIAFRDDGGEGDVAANDGNYIALVRLLQEGQYEVRAAVRGVSSRGEFERTATTFLNVVKPVASLTGTFTDALIDSDGDGLIDTLTVTPGVNVLQNAEYRVDVRLRSAGGRILQQGTWATLSPGMAHPVVRFHGESIEHELKEGGPYVVDRIYLDRWNDDRTDRVFVDQKSAAGVTRAFKLAALYHDVIRLTGPIHASPVDTNGNGLFEQLKIVVELETAVAGPHFFDAALRRPVDRMMLSETRADATFATGRNSIALLFDGTGISTKAVDGPYQLELYVRGPGVAEKKGRFSTGPFKAAQFDRYIPDTTPPTLFTYAAPEILWPPKRDMVRLFVRTHVTDDRDPSPSLRLESVTAAEGPNQLGDAITSADIQVHPDGGISLRRGRSGTGQFDRIYTVTWVATDSSGNVTRSSSTVTVPHDRRE